MCSWCRLSSIKAIGVKFDFLNYSIMGNEKVMGFQLKYGFTNILNGFTFDMIWLVELYILYFSSCSFFRIFVGLVVGEDTKVNILPTVEWFGVSRGASFPCNQV